MGVYEKQMLISENGYINLAAAIVLQAVKDYRKILRAIRKNRNNKSARAKKMHLERFFHSEWFKMLAPLDGEALITKLKEEYGI